MMFFNHIAHFTLIIVVCSTSHAFTIKQRSVTSQLVRRATDGDGSGSNEINGAASTSASKRSSDLVIAVQDNMTRLASAFAALDETDQYDAVLTGLCAKILDDPPPDSDVKAALEEPFKLLQEMNSRRVKASGRSLMALIDATVATQDATKMADMMSLCLKNGGASKFGSLQSTISPFPSSPSTKVITPDGSRKSRQERLAALADIPVDDRGSELSSALACTAFVATCSVANILHMSDVTPFTNSLLVLLAVIGVVDNFYDVIQFTTQQLGTKSTSTTPNSSTPSLSLPDKASLPAQLGSGQWTGTVFRGLTRLTTIDTERECQCEAAAIFAAYVLGLPCFAFRPNALESAVLVVESSKSKQQKSQQQGSMASLDSLLSSVGILKVLVWLLAPVAMESSRYPLLIMSDPRESMGFLERLEDKSKDNGNLAPLLNRSDLFWTNASFDADEDEQEKMDLLKWAYTEADLLLRANRGVVTEISQRLAGGAATVGDCVAVIEGW